VKEPIFPQSGKRAIIIGLDRRKPFRIKELGKRDGRRDI
jgi:hypothetical protein